MKFTDKENTVIADLGINTDYSQSPAIASQDIMKILGTTAGGANALLRSLHKKGVFQTAPDEEGEDAVTFTEKGKLIVRELSGDFDLDMPDEELEVVMDDIEDEDDAPAVTMVQKAAKKAKSKKTTSTATGMRTSHADCSHAKSGSEGKIARAKCRKERAAAAAKANA